MEISRLTYILLILNAALDTGEYDDITMVEVRDRIEAGNVLFWLKSRIPVLDFSLLKADEVAEYEASLADIRESYGGMEGRKWGVRKRGLCLLIAWTNEIIQRKDSAGWHVIPNEP